MGSDLAERTNTVPRSDCPITYALEIFGDRWTLIVLRDLMFGMKSRYKELLASEEGIATNVLAERLKRLERRDLITKERDPKDARQSLYLPTEAAIGLVPMMVEMIYWSLEKRGDAPDLPFARSYREDRETLIENSQRTIRENLEKLRGAGIDH